MITGEVIGQRIFSDGVGTWWGNIVKLRNGKLVTYRADGYRTFNKKTGKINCNEIVKV
jgi:hypothetical protein